MSKESKKSVLVTGGAGYIGTKLVSTLSKKKYKVTVVDNFSSGKKQNRILKVKYYNTDILSKRIYSIIENEKPEIIFHLAALKSIKDSIINPKKFIKVNVEGSKNILTAAQKFGVKKFIFASSAAVYGDVFKDRLQTESQRPKPSSAYGKTKLEIENLIGVYNKKSIIEGIVLRFANVYGLGGKTDSSGVINLFIKNALKNKKISVNGDGSQKRDFIYIDNIVDICIKLCTKSYKNKLKNHYVFNLSTGQGISINEVLEVIQQKIALPKIVYKPNAFYGQKKSVLSPYLTKKIFRWSAETILEQGIKKTILSSRLLVKKEKP